MVYYSKATIPLCVLLILLSAASDAQLCHFRISGRILDAKKDPVPGVIIRIPEDSLGTASGIGGNFSIAGVCPGMHTISFEAVGYNVLSFPIEVDSDQALNVSLTISKNELNAIVITGDKVTELRTVASSELSGEALQQTRGASLGEALKGLPGLNSMQTGPTLSKPVIHGLSGNRVLLINDGVRQEGQQWGSEHAPEIDPFIADKITVVKGAASVRYGSDAIGGVVLLSPDDMPTVKGITGDLYLVGASNGQMGAVSGMLQGAFDKKLEGLSWRVQGTAKDAGNFHTPRYYLINSGLREGDFSANVDYKRKNTDFNIFYSQYNTEVGIFAGAESGNDSELVRKFEMSTPGLPSYFSYKIDRSYQTVFHELLKAAASYHMPGEGKLELTFGRQNDIRKEYDADLPITLNPTAQLSMPQLRFQLITHTLDLIYTQNAAHGFSGSFGITGNTSGNLFEGIRTLIPNFRDYNAGAFAIERYTVKKLTLEAGVRYDYRWLRVYERDPVNLCLYHETYQYNNVTGTIGATYRYNEHLSATINTGSAWRAPSINELYINGEHFSDARYEIGDSTLKSERSVNTNLSIDYKSEKLRVNVSAYYNVIGNYIYEDPLLQLRILPQGAFPVFQYVQDNVNIKGLDASIQYDILPRLTLQSKTTIVRGYNETIHDWLVFMPCDRYQNGVEYHLPSIGKVNDAYVSVENVSVARQTRVPPNSDYVPPPSGYSLFNANAGFTIPVGKNTLHVNFTIDNITNVAYRDYLDHFRYYADELGVNYVLRFKYSF